ncbi:MAG: DHA2 family efflux MFS transporter permease subunit [Alphaproteobacteria bacterium]
MTTAHAEPEPATTGVKSWLALSAAMLGTTVYMLTLTLSGAALPHMQGAFSAAPNQMAWVLTSFIIGTAIMTACSGWLALHFGRTRVFAVSTAGFAAASILCGLSTTLEEALVFRTLQGLFGATLTPLGQAIAIDAFPRRKQGMATAMWSFGGVSGSAIGPYVGGVLVSEYGWPWVFFVNVPLALLACLATLLFVPEIVRAKKSLNWYGFGALAVAITTFQLMLNRGERLDWFSDPEIVIEAAIASLASYLFAIHIITSKSPFFPPLLFRDRNFVFGLFLMFIYGAIVFLQMFLMPVLLQDLGGYGIEDVGGLLGWRAVGLMFGMLLISPISDRIDPRIILVAGFGCLIGSAWAMSDWTVNIRAFDAAAAMFVQGMGGGIAFVPISMMTFSTVPTSARNDGVALFFLTSSLGTATGTALIYNVLTRFMRINHDAMSEVLTPYNELFQQGGMPRLWSLLQRGGLAAMDAEIGRQAAMIAYNNCFYLIALIGLAALPLSIFVRFPKPAR